MTSSSVTRILSTINHNIRCLISKLALCNPRSYYDKMLRQACPAIHPETFNFLGFPHISGQSRKDKFQIQRRTLAQRFGAKLAEVNVKIRLQMHDPVPAQGPCLRSVL